MRSYARVVTLLCAIAAASEAPAAYAASPAARQCSDVTVPVGLAENQPRSYTVHGRLCVPDGSAADTIQVLVHGFTYSHRYWDFPDPTQGTDRYSYVKAANRAGYATLSLDRIGIGHSSHPLGLLVTIDSNAFTVHQVIQAIRTGQITQPDGARFSKVVYVGHSYGSWTGWFEATKYNDLDAIVLTGATHRPTLVSGALAVIPNLYPATLDPKFGPLTRDPTYLTSVPGKRYQMFYAPAQADPAVIAYDEAHKATMTAAEIDNYPLILLRPLDIRVPVLLVAGTSDSLFCGPENAGADCSSSEALVAEERPYLGPNVPSVDAYVLQDAGHSLNQAYNAGDYFDAVSTWIADNVG